ncbi:cellulose synthase/poly-beta-1,6-N-acetylglucosamine synthase-like glycosyltransferase [Sulfuritortus calidifontis]|uniref:Cellulose synthase/poly-beta-1,6-N-acetylglucosamine synthase-like glycosyltransferase n=2 Tax=Sulfuritortus calidifontis TaxID=1914471 RepID=A0A4R3JXM8_9PROT|nr:cellulose synthase/poly-beta-1,6-N-acetylglucosamine synthase-like glycosyltransferase [Sulfuritortus calidifontis]
MLQDIVYATQWLFLLYFSGLSLVYTGLNLIALYAVARTSASRSLDALPRLYSGLEPPISLLVPAYNEASTIAGSVRSMLQLAYPEFEIVVINDGSRDDTLKVLKQEFSLQVFPEAYRVRLKTQPVRAIYHSTLYPNLRVIDKENGGKADSLNAGINASRYPLFCAVDADSILQRDSLQRVVRPFLADPRVIAAGGTVRIANGCTVARGFLKDIGLPSSPLALFQIVEYLRAFLFGRMGWSPINAMLIISGAFGLFRKEAVIAAGGYRTDTVGEDMELVVRLHRLYRQNKKPYRVVFVTDPICWTEAPEDLRTLKNQRVRWQRGLMESLWFNRSLMFHRNGGLVGWLAFPFALFFEGLGPLIELGGFLILTLATLTGAISWPAFGVFLLLAVGVGLLLTSSALLLEEITFHVYPRPAQVARLYLAMLGENVGFRQLNSWWRLLGLWRWLIGTKGHWGEMQRSARWQNNQ